MKWFLVVVLAAVSGCTAVHVERKIRDAQGHDRGTITIDNRVASSNDVRVILGETTRFEETQNRELETIAADSVARGKPTTVTSGYTGYGNYGYGVGYNGGYNVPGYDPYSDPMAYAPGVAPEMLIAAELARRGGYLPPLAQPTIPLQPQGKGGTQPAVIDDGQERVECPNDRPAVGTAERLSCLEEARRMFLLMHKRNK